MQKLLSVHSDIYIGRLVKYKCSTPTNVDFSGTGGKKGRDEDDPVEGPIPTVPVS